MLANVAATPEDANHGAGEELVAEVLFSELLQQRKVRDVCCPSKATLRLWRHLSSSMSRVWVGVPVGGCTMCASLARGSSVWLQYVTTV